MQHRTVVPIVCLVLTVAACTSTDASHTSAAPSISTSPVLTPTERWTADIMFLVEQMEGIHPDLFHGVSAAAFHRTADELIDAAPDLDDDELTVGIMRLVAMISAHGGDGHMGVWPPDNTHAVHRFPIRLWEFPDGLYVTAARAPNGDLAGARVLKVDGLGIAAVFKRLDPVVPRDTPSNLRAARTVFLTSAEVLTGLGISDDRRTMVLDVETPDGERRSATVEAVDATTYGDWVGGWELLLPERAGLDFLRDAQESFGVDYLPSERTLDVRYNVVWEHSAAVVGAIRSVMRDRPVDRIVLDLRNNGGGEAGGFRDLLRFLEDTPVPLVVLVGRLTFSAGSTLGLQLERRVPTAVFIGETMGGAPAFWADPDTVTLPYSGLVALVDSRFFRSPTPGDRRLQVQPDVAVAFTSTDYFAGRDPVLERALG
jgi:hypothetical protein